VAVVVAVAEVQTAGKSILSEGDPLAAGRAVSVPGRELEVEASALGVELVAVILLVLRSLGDVAGGVDTA